MTPSWDWDCIMSCHTSDPRARAQSASRHWDRKRTTGPVGNWLFDIPSSLAHHHQPSQIQEQHRYPPHPLTTIMSRHHHKDSGTIPSMMSVQHELRDNTVILGKRISHSLWSHAYAFPQSLVHRAISQRRRSARLEIALPSPSIVFSNPSPLHRHSRLSSGCIAMVSCPRASR